MNKPLWLLRMAFRDSRGSRRRLVFFVLSLSLGVAALVSINSFGETLRNAVDEQAMALLGADMGFDRDLPFDQETEALIDSIGGDQARRISFPSMALFPKANRTRLASVRAISGPFPFYGAIETAPPEAAKEYQSGDYALVDGSLLTQYELGVGDSVRVGGQSYEIAGRLVRTARESAAFALIAPRVYIPLEGLDTTLVGFGSQAEYEVFFRFDDGRDVEALASALKPRLRVRDIDIDTVAEEKEDWNEALRNLYRFLGLVALMALLLGSIGVASVIHVYIKQRLENVALLRCLGVTSRDAFAIYLIQAIAIGLAGSLLGALIGVGVQAVVPRVLADFLPVQVTFSVSFLSILAGVAVGCFVTLLFALMPLLGVRRVSPLQALRSEVETSATRRIDVPRFIVALLVVVGFGLVALLQAPNVIVGLAYLATVLVVVGLLAGVARVIVTILRRSVPTRWSYPIRQGLANLHRPGNQTLVLLIAVGFGAFLIMTLFVARKSLLEQIRLADAENRPNLILFDIQPDQREGVRDIVTSNGLAIVEEAPIVTMRISSINGRSIETMREDPETQVTWAHRREYRSTYRDHLTDTETLLAGEFVPTVDDDVDVVPVSIERDIMSDLRVELGDTLVFDVQGLPMTTRLASVREVDWQRVQTNFFFVFPGGVLEAAPQTWVTVTRAPDENASGALQSLVVDRYPNISAIDLSLIFSVFEEIFARLSFVIRFMAMFSIATGLLVLAGAVVISRFRRIEESVLLKTLGASKRQVLQIATVEYFVLGSLAALTGLILSLLASAALTRFVFEVPFRVPAGMLLLTLFGVAGLTMVIGLVNSRGVYDRGPLEVLRAEV